MEIQGGQGTNRKAACAQHGKTTVIDSDEFAQNPEAGIRLLCERLKLDFRPEMLEWSPQKKLDTNWEGWNPFFERVQTATRFETPSDKNSKATDHTKSLPDLIESEVEKVMPAYLKMRAVRTIIPTPDNTE